MKIENLLVKAKVATESETLEDLSSFLASSCGKCVWFKTPKCRYSYKNRPYDIHPEHRPCENGFIAIIIGSDVILRKGKTELIKPIRFLSSNKTKAEILETFDILSYELEEAIITIKKRHIKSKLKRKQKRKEKPKPEPKELYPELRNEAVALLKNPDLLSEFIKHSNKWLIMDEPVRTIELLTCVSAYGTYPLNLALQQVYSSGKTRTIVVTAKYFEDQKDDVWLLGKLSPTALIHERGEYDEEKDLYKIDLEKKVLIFLDEPQFKTLEMLKPLLSRDKYETMYKITHKDTMKTITSILKGFPVCVFCAVKSKFTMEFCSRWLTASPSINPEKIKKVIAQKSDMAMHPERYKEEKNFKVWQKAFSVLKEGFPYQVVIPYASTIGNNFRAKKQTDMRFYDLFLALIKASTILHAYQRERDEKERLIASVKDYEIAQDVFKQIEKSTVFGLGENILSFYNDVVLPCAPNEVSYATYETLMQKHYEVYGEPKNRNQIRYEYLKPLERSGLIDIQEHPQDKRAKAIFSTGNLRDISLINHEAIKKTLKIL